MTDLSKLVVDEACHLLDQSMAKINNCLAQLDDSQIWFRPAEPLNSIGNLLLHLAGNLKQWSVVGIGGEPDLRQREQEFREREMIPKAELMERLELTVANAKSLFQGLSLEQLMETRHIQEFDTTVYQAMSHTTTHFVGHTHQIIYLTRMQLGKRYQYHWSPANDSSNVPI